MIGIFCVIFLAVAYWAVLWLMGRRNDVLHGDFVKASRMPMNLCALYSRSVRLDPPPERLTEAAPEQPAFRQERLESLLNTIKQDLNQLVQK